MPSHRPRRPEICVHTRSRNHCRVMMTDSRAVSCSFEGRCIYIKVIGWLIEQSNCFLRSVMRMRRLRSPRRASWPSSAVSTAKLNRDIIPRLFILVCRLDHSSHRDRSKRFSQIDVWMRLIDVKDISPSHPLRMYRCQVLFTHDHAKIASSFPPPFPDNTTIPPCGSWSWGLIERLSPKPFDISSLRWPYCPDGPGECILQFSSSV